MVKRRAYDGETCSVYYGSRAYSMLMLVFSIGFFGIQSLFMAIITISNYRRNGTIGDDWFVLLFWVGIGSVIITLNVWYVRRRPMLLVSASGIGYVTATHSLWTEWANVERLVQDTTLLLREAEEVRGFNLNTKTFTDVSIPLWFFHYSPRSQLGNELRAYAPHLFTKKQA